MHDSSCHSVTNSQWKNNRSQFFWAKAVKISVEKREVSHGTSRRWASVLSYVLTFTLNNFWNSKFNKKCYKIFFVEHLIFFKNLYSFFLGTDLFISYKIPKLKSQIVQTDQCLRLDYMETVCLMKIFNWTFFVEHSISYKNMYSSIFPAW